MTTAAARRIRNEMVCCDIFEVMEGLLDPVTGAVTPQWREAKRSYAYHDVCYFGEWAAREAEGKVSGGTYAAGVSSSFDTGVIEVGAANELGDDVAFPLTYDAAEVLRDGLNDALEHFDECAWNAAVAAGLVRRTSWDYLRFMVRRRRPGR